MDAVSSFLPSLLIEPINGGQINASQATYETQFSACLLFADISGFTALAERLDQEGAEGAERLTLVLNRYFGEFIQIVHQHGGDVAKFAGDALLAVWRAEAPQNVHNQAHRVHACGLALQDFMSRQDPEGPIQLKMKVAVSTGQLNMVCIGGLLNRREMVLSSPALAELGKANDEAEAGDFIVCASLKPYLNQKPSEQPQAPTLSTKLCEQALQIGLEFIPAAIRKSLNAKQDDWINENRQVSILFVNLSEFAGQLPVETTQQCMIALQRSLYTVEGSVNKISVDDKGVSLMGVLGMPPFTHADDPQRALKAAILMHQELCHLGIKHQIGVSTGTVFCGVVGTTKRREYTIMGDAVNLSARLMQKTNQLKSGAPILIDEATERACKQQFELTKFATVKLKGKTTPMALFQPTNLTGKSQPHTSPQNLFVGRYAEIEQMRTCLNRTESKKANGLLIRGPVGIGRTSLIRKYLNLAESNAFIVEQNCSAMESKLPWHAWQIYFRSHFGLNESMTANQINHSIVDQLTGIELQDLAPLLEAVIPAAWEDNETTKNLSGEQRATETLKLLKRLILDADSKSPLQLVLYNIEWLDSFSLNLLMELLTTGLTYPIVLSTSPERLETHQNLSRLESNPLLHVINLGPLSDTETIELSTARAEGKPLPAQAQKLIQERAGGSPLFVLQATDALLESQWLTCDESGEYIWRAPEGSHDLSLPHSIDGLIISRIDRIDPDIQLTGKTASVIGTEVDFDHVCQLHPMRANEKTIEQHVQTLQGRGLAHFKQESDSTPNTRFEFNNEAITQAFYKLLAGFQRRDLHFKLAELMESSQDLSLPAHKALLAFHYQHACTQGDQSDEPFALTARLKACQFYLELAHRAIRLGASEEAEEGFKQILALVKNQAQKQLEEFEVDALLGLSTVRSTRFGWADAMAAQALEQALQKSTNTSQALKIFQAVRGLWQVKVANSEYETAMKLALELDEKAKASQHLPHGARMQAEAKRALGTTHFWIGQFEQSQLLLNESLEILANLDLNDQSSVTLAQDTEVSARGILAWAYALQDLDDLALKEAKIAFELSEKIDSAFTQAYARGAAMWTCLHISNVEQALVYADLTLEISREKGYDYFTTAALVVRGWSNAWAGFESGINEIKEAIKDWQDKGQNIGVPAFLLQQARALERFDRLEEAVTVLQTPIFMDTLPKEPWIEHLVVKMLGHKIDLNLLAP